MRLLYCLACVSFAVSCFAQQNEFQSQTFEGIGIVTYFSADDEGGPIDGQQNPPPNPPSTSHQQQADTQANGQLVPKSQEQPKRILGVMPNYRAVSAGALPPPPTPGQAFKIATQNSFDYSSFVFTGITSAIALADDAHKQLGEGWSGYWAYYWRGFVDKTDGNYLVLFALPTVFHQDERYFAMGTGGIKKRAIYAATRVFITPNYQGHNTFNTSELLGRAIAQGVSTTYYPSQDRTFGELATKWGYAVMRDALTNVFREFWPDIATHVLHRHP